MLRMVNHDEQITFYVHEIRTGPEATFKLAVGTGNRALNKVGWGSLCVFDNVLREGQAQDSKLLGRELDYGTVTAMEGNQGRVQLESTVTFSEGSKYGGSTLTFDGKGGGSKTPYELIVVGSTGHF